MKALMSIRSLIVIILLINPCLYVKAQFGDPLTTPLPQEILDILTNEISGQVIYNNMVAVNGAPWIRTEKEFTDTFHETSKMFELVKSYGIETVRIDRSESDREFDYPIEGELWITAPEKKLIARLDADVALIARGSKSADISGELIYMPPLNEEQLSEILKPEYRDSYNGKIALMWSHPRGELANILDSIGIQGVISFSARERYVDPNMVVYSSGSYSSGKNLKLGMTISWKQWSELLEDLEYQEAITVRCRSVVEKKQDKFEAVFSWIPGTEPDKPGVIFTAHLFEGYTKRGANDNTGGCVVQLEILRSISKLIKEGVIDQPRRNIYFLWPNEISGTYKFISENPDLIANTCININMDMVTEGLRLNNSWMTMGETPAQLASFYDGLANSVLNYVWRTNDIVYLPDSPRGRRGGQYFPKPMLEKNGSVDAFRYFVHEATGGSDHICFNNSSVGVPAIEYFTWPDYWYHADTDTPDKGDPTQMKRVAFIGAATAYATANCTDDILDNLLDATSEFAYKRFAERGISKALSIVNASDDESFEKDMLMARKIVDIASEREIRALKSVSNIYSGSASSKNILGLRLDQWENYQTLMQKNIDEAIKLKGISLGKSISDDSDKTKLRIKLGKLTPVLTDKVMYKVFSPAAFEPLNEYLANNPDSPGARIARSRDSRTLISYVNGSLSISGIIDYAEVYSGKAFNEQDVYDYFLLLEKVNYLRFK